MKRIIFVLIGLAVFVPAAILVYMRYCFVVHEGYPTWQAVRNCLVRDGEIVIFLPEGVKVDSAHCDEPGNIEIDGHKVTTKIGYGWPTIVIRIEGNSGFETIRFRPQKFNNWNRILFVPADESDPESTFLKFENGVEEAHSDVTREPITNHE